MHIFKSRNPLWLIGDVLCAWGFWSLGIYFTAVFFTIDSILQLIYTFFPEAIDTLEKKKGFRLFYILGLLGAVYFIFKALYDKGFI